MSGLDRGRQSAGRRYGSSPSAAPASSSASPGPAGGGSTLPFVPPPGRTIARRERRIPLAPQEGWLTVLLVVLLVMPVAWSIDDARWVLGKQSLTAFLPWAVIGGAAWGMIGAKVGWSRWLTHVLGAVVAILVVGILVGMTIDPAAGSIGGWFRATASSAVEAVLDFTVRGRIVTTQVGHHLLVFGLVCWATAQFAGYATLGHRRPLGAIFITGIALLIDMSVTNRDQMPFLVIFSLAALLLLVRVHADDERLSWLQRRIGDPNTVTSLYLRGGTTFVTIAILGSLFLTSTAASAPLAGAFDGLSAKLIEFGQQVQRFLPVGGAGTRLPGVAFGGTVTITGSWQNDTTPALTIHLPPGDTTSYYWKAVAYDTFTGNGWTLSNDHPVARAANTSVLDGTQDEVPSPDTLRKPLTFSVERLRWVGSNIFAPDAIDSVGTAATLTTTGSAAFYGALGTGGDWHLYTATALVPKNAAPGSAEGFTDNNLLVASRDYPLAIQQTYLNTGPPGTILRGALDVEAEIRAEAKALYPEYPDSPFALAKAAVALFRSDEFTYDTDVVDLLAGSCKDLSMVECFAEAKRGYCQFYASTMAVLLRHMGIPTRYVQGWLPGGRNPITGEETILMSNAHAWVEVYFPDYGWVTFDPTHNGEAGVPQFPVGPKASPKPTPSPGVRRSGDENGPDVSGRRSAATGAGGGQTPPGPSSALLAVVAVLLLLIVAALALVAYQRGPRGPTQPDTAWSTVTHLAARFGWAPRPTQTPYEYAAALGDLLPVARPDLHIVASAKVESVYGRKILDSARLSALRTAQRKLRITLLRLFFRRPKRPGRRRGG